MLGKVGASNVEDGFPGEAKAPRGLQLGKVVQFSTTFVYFTPQHLPDSRAESNFLRATVCSPGENLPGNDGPDSDDMTRVWNILSGSAVFRVQES